jgi:hypothetical protein
MARLTATNYTGTLQFPYATAGTDLFRKEDVQTLALAVDQHDHSVGKGLGVSGGGIKNAIDMPDWYRSTGHATAFAAAGQGLEMFYDSSSPAGVVQSYNRGGLVFTPLKLLGSTVGLFAGAGSEALHFASDGSAAFNFPLTCNSTLAVGGPTNLTGTLTCNGIAAAGVTATGVTVNGSLNVSGGIGTPVNLTLTGTGAISTAAGNLILRSASGLVAMDAGGGLSITGPLTVTGGITGGAVTSQNALACPQINLTGGLGQYFLPVSGSIRYAAVSPGSHSFEYTAGGYAPCVGASFTPSSARRFKTDIVPLADPLSIVTDERVHGVSYTEIASGDRKVGFVADDWVTVEPSVVVLDDIGDVLALDYDRIGAVTFEALKAYIARTEARLAVLEGRTA